MAERTKPNSDAGSQESSFPIVGVVASAGGLTALKQMLGAIQNHCDMAFVLVPHLDPKQESQMVVILSKDCVLPVIEATDAMVPEANHVYVIPSKFYLTIRDGAFCLSQPSEPEIRETAIDIFLRSLAADQGERSIGIVLSGTGSHGTLGIRDIKIAGGMAIAQDPATAEFDTMPASVIREGLSDYVLSPSEIPATLGRYMQQPYINVAAPATQEIQDDDGQLNAILDLLREHTHFDFRSYRKNMVLRRVQRRMGLHQTETWQQYIQLLKNDSVEVTALYHDLLISVTSFFRDPEAYETLSKTIRPALATRDADRFPFRVWVPGCATGEEAYSLALQLIECLDERSDIDPHHSPSSNSIQLFASDVDEAAIAIARTGIYPTSIFADVSEDRLKRFFTRAENANYKIGKQLRDAIVFSRQNVIQDPPFSKLDLISCRNLLIYLEPETQQKVLMLFHFALADDGLLVLGPAESLGHASELFIPISKKWRIFQRQPSRRRSHVVYPTATTNSLRNTPAYAPANTHVKTLTRQTQKAAKPKRQRGTIGRFLHSLRFATFDFWHDWGGPPTESKLVLQMKRKIQTNGEELGGVIAELERANEDLKTSNEEIMSMNEELQSANEELETSKEELQSLNEELSTVNQELLEKVSELDIANSDILNLIASTEIATLFLDTDLHIQRFTPPTVALFNLRLIDLGRPLSDITARFDDGDLYRDCQKVLEGSASIQREITGHNKRLYLRRILPYRSQGDHVSGAVITFVDFTDRLTLESSLKESNDHILEIASEEQQRIGQELHDGTQQELTGLSLIAGTIEDFFAHKVQLKGDDHDSILFNHEELSRCMETFTKLVRGLKEANQHVQSLSHGIMPVQIDAEGLQSALTELACATTVGGKVACDFVQHGRSTIQNNTVATHLYRIAQEAVNNAQRHGKANGIRISLTTHEHQMALEISDDGIGFDEVTLRNHSKEGKGLQIMEYRARLTGGVLSISRGRHHGTIVRCTITTQKKTE